jgi:adenylate cyclase class IV
MACNIEIKARVGDLAALEARVRAIASHGPEPIDQEDTFFHCPQGRLKLRQFDTARGELIAYRRDDVAGPKASHYLRVPTPEPEALREALAMALGVAGRVAKQRVLYLVGRTRVHLDRVEGLGHYMELEVVLGEGEPAEAGAAEARALMATLGIVPADLVEGAYADLLGARAKAGGTARHDAGPSNDTPPEPSADRPAGAPAGLPAGLPAGDTSPGRHQPSPPQESP